MKKLLLLTSLFLGGTFAAMATHVMGSDITYRCVSNKKFEITLKIYRDCRGVSLGNPGAFSVVCATGGSPRNFSYSKTGIRDITPKCRSSANPCNPSNTYNPSGPEGVEEHTYVGTIDFTSGSLASDLAGGCCEFKIYYEECCRNNAINTGSAGTFYADATINVCKAPCNNSPKMTNEPIAYLCCNQSFTFNNGVSDTADYDSISYSLVSAKDGGGSGFSYGSGYTPTRPLTPYYPPSWPNPNNTNPNANPPIGFFLDPITGDIIFTPTGCTEVGPCVIQVNEWRKDSTGTYQKIGETRRDLQLIVKNCPGNNPPTIGTVFSHTVCESKQICFTVQTRDNRFILPPPQTSPPPDSLDVSWNQGISGATFTIDTITTISGNISQRNGRFCWTPPVGKASSLPYTFTVTSKDNSCNPRPASSTRGFSVRVKPLAQAERTYTPLTCGKVRFHATPKDNTISNYVWSIRDSTNTIITSSHANKSYIFRQTDTVTFKKGGKYIINLNINNTANCENTYIDTIIVPELLEVDLALGADTFVCAGSSMTLLARVKNGVSPFRYKWTSSATNDTLTTKTFTPLADSMMTIRVTDKNGCVVNDTTIVKYKPLPVVDLGPDPRICDYDSFTFNAQHPGKKFDWSPNGDTTQTITVNVAGEYRVVVTDSFGCIGKDTVILNVNDHVAPIARPDRELCIGDTIKLGARGGDTTGGKTNQYGWSFITGSNRMINQGDTILVYSTSQSTFKLHLVTTQSGVQCFGDDTVKVDINQLPTLNPYTLDDKCFNYGEFNFALYGAFTPSGGVYSYAKNPAAIYNGTTAMISDLGREDLTTIANITYTYTDAKGCTSVDSVPQKIMRLPVVQVMDAKYCKNVGFKDLKSHVITPKNFFAGSDKWTSLNYPDAVFKDGTKWMFDPAYKSAPETYLLEYEYKDGNGCANRDTSIVQVVNVPVIAFTNQPGPYCAFSGPYHLSTVSGVDPQTGWWSLGARHAGQGLSVLTSTGNLLTDKETGTFTLVYRDTSTGCLVVDSIDVVIHPLPNVSVTVPTGKNKVCETEATFQMIGSPSGGTYTSTPANIVSASGTVTPSNKADGDNLITGTYPITYKYKDPSTQCENSANATIQIETPPTVTISVVDDALCEEEIFMISYDTSYAPNGATWTVDGDGQMNSTQTQYTPGTQDNLDGTVKLTATTVSFTGQVCPVATDNKDLTIHPKPVASFVGDSLIGCAPLTTRFSLSVTKPTSGVEYLWNFGDPDSGPDNTSTEEDPTHVYLNEGKFTVSVRMTSEHGCVQTLTENQYISVYPVPVADFLIDPATKFTTIALPKFSFKNKSKISTGSLSYFWDFGVPSTDDDTSTTEDPSYMYSNSPKDTGTYIVRLRIVSDGGCWAEHIDSIRIGPDLTVFIPNAFTPNKFGNPINNRFFVHAQGFAAFEVNIFNRWGEKLYTSKDINEGWDGTYKSQDCQQDVYVYQVNVTSFSGRVYKYNGTVTLLR